MCTCSSFLNNICEPNLVCSSLEHQQRVTVTPSTIAEAQCSAACATSAHLPATTHNKHD